MRRFALVFLIALLFTIQGCKFLPFAAKPSPTPEATEEVQTQDSETQSPAPTPSSQQEDDEEASNAPTVYLGINQSIEQTSVPKPSATAPSDDTVNFYLQGGEADTYYSSEEDYAFTDDVSVDIDLDGDGTVDTINIDFNTNYPEDEGNKPVDITFTIGSLSVSYENLWNDGVYVAFAEFDYNDPYLDIYIHASGTDVSANISTYRYDGSKLYNYLEFGVFEDSMFYYDTAGYIYYLGAYDQNYGVALFIDYKTGDIYTIE